MTDLATTLHNFDMANTRRGSHHADGLGRMQDLVDGPIAEILALGEGDRRDAERFRFLRDGYREDDDSHKAWFAAYDVLGGPYTPEHINAEIDAAIAALRGEGEE